VFTDHDNDYNPHTASTSECHAAVRYATPPKHDNIHVETYDAERDDAPIGMSSRSSDMIQHGVGTLSLSNIVSGVVGSPTRRDDTDTAGCNNVTTTDADTNKAGCNTDKYTVTDANIYDTHAHISHIDNDTHGDNHDNCNSTTVYSDTNDKPHEHKSFATAIAMYGTVNNIPALILFDSGAEGVFISELLIEKYDIHTQHEDNVVTGIMADGTKQHINKIAKNVKIQIQDYTDSIDLHVLPISQYGIILGVPWHESVNAITHHRQRTISLTQRYSDDSVNKMTLIQQRRDRRIQRDMRNHVSCADSILVSAVQLKRWMRQRSKYENGVKVKETPAMIYIIHINTIDGHTKKNNEDTNNNIQHCIQTYVVIYHQDYHLNVVMIIT
jgi:hypothetical protein